MREAIPGWQVDRTGLRDPGRRPAGDLIADALRVYRTRPRPILVFATLVEGTASLLTLPYLAGQWLTFGAATVTTSAGLGPDEQAAVLAGAVSGLVTVIALLSSWLLTALVAAALFAGPERDPIRFPIGQLDRRWRTIVPACLLLLVAGAAVGAIATAALWPLASDPAALHPTRRALLVLGALTVTCGGIAIAIYFAIRWAVAIPAFIVEAFGIRTSLNRSSALTRRRMGHVTLVIVASSVVVAILLWLAMLLAAGVVWLGGGAPVAVVIGAAGYVVGRILVAPISPLVTAVLYRDLREAGMAPG